MEFLSAINQFIFKRVFFQREDDCHAKLQFRSRNFKKLMRFQLIFNNVVFSEVLTPDSFFLVIEISLAGQKNLIMRVWTRSRMRHQQKALRRRITKGKKAFVCPNLGSTLQINNSQEIFFRELGGKVEKLFSV